MEQEIIIGISVASALAVIIAAKVWLHRLIKFKMDESIILKFIEDSTGNNKAFTAETLSANTSLTIERVTQVCSHSKAMRDDTEKQQSWRLKK